MHWEHGYARAAQHVAEGRDILAAQRERTDRLRSPGSLVATQEQTLSLFISTLDNSERHEHSLWRECFVDSARTTANRM